MQWFASAASTAGVLLGQGPSSNVSTTSPGLRKSWVLKCSNPNPGPPVVSIWSVRVRPSPFGLAQATGCGAGGAGGGLAAGACATAAGAAGAAAGVEVEAANVVGFDRVVLAVAATGV